tara:strand:- start:604 stop:732 length:129 start_codon:yes stop_codon:yes gene_type:complete
MVSDGTTINIICGRVYYRNDMWWGAEHNEEGGGFYIQVDNRN